MIHQYDAGVTLAKTKSLIRNAIFSERSKVQLQASKLSMRFKSTTRWELLNYPFVVPENINLANPLDQDSSLANLPKEILLAIFANLEKDEVFKSGSLAMSCKRICQTALLAKPSKTKKFLEILGWQPRDLKWCSGCGYNRPYDHEYWNEKRCHCHAWSDLKNDVHQFSSARARYEDHEIDVNMWIYGWCSAVSPSAGTVKGNREDQWCPPCRAQWNWEISEVEAALVFDMDFRYLKEHELLLKMDGWGDDLRVSMQEWDEMMYRTTCGNANHLLMC